MMQRMHTIVMLLIFSFMAVMPVDAAYTVIKSVTIGASGGYYEPYSGLPVIDNFDDNGAINNVNGGTGTFQSTGATCVKTNVVRDAGYAVKIDYDVRTTNTYCGYYTKLKESSFNPYSHLVFDVKGNVGGEYFKIQMTTNAGTYTQASVMITDALGATATTGWQTVSVPLLSFINLEDISSMKELVFVFENAQSSANGSPLQGTVYLDNIKVENRTVNTLLVDNFNDKVGTCSLGGNIVDPSPNGNDVSHSFNGTTMLSTYDLSNQSWCGQTLIFGGGAEPVTPKADVGFVSVPRSELLGFNSVRIKSNVVSGTPRVKVELSVYVDGFHSLVDKQWYNAYAYFNANGTEIIDLDNFTVAMPGMSLSFASFKPYITNMAGKLSIIYERKTGYTNTGSISIDSIELLK